MSLAPLPKGKVGLARHTASIALKEWLHIVRSRRELALILTLPALLTFLFGYAFEVGEVRAIPTAVADEDGSPLSARLVAAMERDPALHVDRVALEAGPARRALERDRYLVVVRIPRGTEQAARRTGRASVPVDLSGVDTVSAPTALRALTRIVALESGKLLALRLSAVGLDGEDLPRTLEPLRLQARVLYNPELRFINWVMPGIIGLILQLLTVGLMAGSLTREKELGTFEALLASPMRPLALLLGKSLPYAAVSAFEVATILLIARLGFGVSLGRGAAPAALLALLFTAAAIATGLLISSLTETQAQSLQATVFYSLPVFMLSGAYAPLTIVPPDVRWISWLFPLTYFCRAFRAIGMKELPLSAVRFDIGMLVAFTAGSVAVARVMLRKRIR